MPDDLRAALNMLRTLTYDDLTDTLDMLAIARDMPSARTRRKGKAGGSENVLRSAAARQAWQYVGALSKDDQDTIAGVITTLHRALAPQAQRRQDADHQPLARGTVQTKTIPRLKTNRETGELETRYYGPYVYIRLWATGGDADRRKKRLQNIYVPNSRGLAAALLAGKVSADEILDAYHTGNIAELCERWP